MTEHADKITLLKNLQDGYTEFDTLLGTLSEGQLTSNGVNGAWSVKDNIAHLSSWHKRLIAMLQATIDNVDLPDPTPGLSEEEINEQFYQQNKDRSLNEVLSEFRSTHQQIIDKLQLMSDDDLNKPLSWLEDRPVWPFIVGNTYGHYEEHSTIIRSWLSK